ncbi:MAG: PAS domain S-box protein [Pseudomonadota bacterium]
MAGNAWWPALGTAAGNALSVWLACRLVEWRFPGTHLLSGMRQYVGLLCAGAVAAVVSAAVGMFVFSVAGLLPPADVPYRFLSWWQGDFLGVLIVAPIVLRIAGRRRLLPVRTSQWALLLATFLLGQTIYAGWFPQLLGIYARDYWTFLLVMASAMAAGRYLTALLVGMTAVQVLAGLDAGVNRFGTGIDEDSLTACWMFLTVLSLSGMATAIVARERRQAAQLIERADLRRRRSLDAMVEGLLLQDAGGKIIECNPAAERILGVSAGQIANSLSVDPRWRAVHEDGSPYPAEQHPAQLALAAGKPVRDAVIGLHRPDGARVWLSVNAEPLIDAQGRVEGVVSTFADITHLRHSIEELTTKTELLSRQEQFLAVIAENIPAMIVYWTRDLRCAYANARGREWFGLDEQTTKNATMESLIGSRLFSRRRMHIEAVLRGEPQVFEGVLEDARGNSIEASLKYVPDRREDGFVRGFIVLINDVTSIKRAAADRLRLASIVEAAEDAIFSTDPAGIVQAWNRGAETLFGAPAAQAIGQSACGLMGCDDPAMFEGMLARVGRRESLRVQRTLFPQGPDAPVEVSVAVAPILDEQEAVLAVSWIVRNVSERVRAERQLLALNADLDRRVEERTRQLYEAKQVAESAMEERSRFIANVSHEIRTPLNAILGMSHLALATALDPRQRDYLQKIRISGDHLLSLIDSLLDFSRGESGKLALENIDFRLDTVLQTVAAVGGPVLEAADRRLVIDMAGDVPPDLNGDPLRLGQMLINYVNNAIKFADAGDVTLRVRMLSRAADSVVLRFDVEDCGIGIPEEVRERLFRPFLQADPSTRRRFGGTGLGLAITAQIAGLMGGGVGAENRQGAGSRFWFTARFGIAASAAPPVPVVSLPPADHALQGVSVLLVEDSVLNRQVCGEMLGLAGARVVMAASGMQALEIMRGGERVDCILMDVQMPGMNGIETTLLLRQEGLLAGIPVLALTANSASEDRAGCFAVGMADFITKPVKPAILYRRILAALDTARNGGAEPVIDGQVLREYIGNRPETINRYVGLFVDMASVRLHEARMGCMTGDMRGLAALGHQLKSSARQIGALSFATLCEELESRGAGMTGDEALHLLDRLQALLVRIREWLARREAGE